MNTMKEYKLDDGGIYIFRPPKKNYWMGCTQCGMTPAKFTVYVANERFIKLRCECGMERTVKSELVMG